MSLDKLDDYLTTDPADRETCEHGRVKPCDLCTREAVEEAEEQRREEQDADR